MNTEDILFLKSRVHRLERQNRWLIAILCVLAGTGLIAATKHTARIIDADEIRAQRVTIVDLQGRICSYTQGANGQTVEGGPITDYPALTPRPDGAPVVSKWKHFGLFP